MTYVQASPVLELKGIHKAFPGVKAFADAGLRLYAGEVHTLMGQNGTGKSYLLIVCSLSICCLDMRCTLRGQNSTRSPR